MKNESKNMKNLDLHEVFDIRSANDLVGEARRRPHPRSIFGDLWHEGELAILFGDVGRGKSALAVQIAESIARGKAALAPLLDIRDGGVIADGVVEPPADKPRGVLYLDFEMSAKQFEMRYAHESADKSGNEHLTRHYKFSRRLTHVSLRPEFLARASAPLEDALGPLIEQLVRQTKASVLIIDSINSIRRTAEGTREYVRLMQHLQRLNRMLGISILVVAHSVHRVNRARPLDIADLHGSRVLTHFADSIFTVGDSNRDPSERYIKHLRTRSGEIAHDESVPVFRIKKISGNFLGFEFRRYAPEAELLHACACSDAHDPETVQKIQDLAAKGATVRAIADDREMSKSTVHRIVAASQLWTTGLTAEPGRPGEERAKNGQEQLQALETPSRETAREQYAKRREPREPVPPPAAGEKSVPPAAAGGAFERLKDKGEGIKENEAGSVDPSPAGPQCGSPHEVRAIHSTRPHELPSCTGRVAEGRGGRAPQHTDTTTVAEPPQIIDTPYRHTAARPEVLDHFAGTGRDRDPACEFIEVEIHYDTEATDDSPRPTSVRLHRTFDEEGREIFVEKYTEWGRRRIWYQVNERGTIFRKLYTGICVEVTNVVKIGSQVRWRPPAPPP